MSSIGSTGTDVGATDRNVLAELDRRAPTSFYWSLTSPRCLLCHGRYDDTRSALGRLGSGANVSAA